MRIGIEARRKVLRRCTLSRERRTRPLRRYAVRDHRSSAEQGPGPETTVVGERAFRFPPPMVLLRVAGLPYVVNVEAVAKHAGLDVDETAEILKRLSARADIPISATLPAEERSGR